MQDLPTPVTARAPVHPRPGDPAPAAHDGACPAITDAEIRAAAQTMSLAGAGAGGGPRLLCVLLDASGNLRELTDRIHAQPGIAVRVMRVANSAYYGHSGRVGTIERAAQVLGLTLLRGVAAAACFDRLSAPSSRGSAFDIAAFRAHSLAAACAAQALAREAAPELADRAFMAGLLHDLGTVVQWRLRPTWLARSRGLPPPPAGESGTWHARESRGLGASHAHCGRVLLDAWHLPADLVHAVGAHDASRADDGPVANDAARLAALVGLADRMADVAGFGFDGDPPREEDDGPAAARLGLDEARVSAIAQALPETVERLSASFGDGPGASAA